MLKVLFVGVVVGVTAYQLGKHNKKIKSQVKSLFKQVEVFSEDAKNKLVNRVKNVTNAVV